MIGVQPWVSGCWRRESIEFRSGAVDRETQVFWVQSGRYCGDIRVPAIRQGPACVQASLSQCHMTGDSAVWEREIAYHPKRHFPEPGLLSLNGDLMTERAPSGEYEEAWRRQPGSDGVRAAYRLAGAGREGRLVCAGDHLFLALDRPSPLGGDLTLQEMLAAGADPAGLFDCEFSYAHRASATEPFEVRLSTLIDREGAAIGRFSDPTFSAERILHATDQGEWTWVRLDDFAVSR